MNELVNILNAISDINRLRILKMLELKPLCVCEITHVLGLATSTVSSHLKVLRKAGLIRSSKSGKWVDYSLNTDFRSIEGRQIMALMPLWLNEDEKINSDKMMLINADRNLICRF